MAQDFGDDAGEMLLRALGNAASRAVTIYINQHAKEWYMSQYQKEGLSKEDAEVKAEAMASREQVCLPFGNVNEASYFAQVCLENGAYVAAYSDNEGGGYIAFAKEDLPLVEKCCPQFSEVMTLLHNQEIADKLNRAQPVTEERFSELTQVTDLPDLPTQGNDAPAQAVNDHALNHTEFIRDKVLAARDQCVDFADFERILAESHIGVTTTQAGEVMFYEARVADGELLPFGQDENGKQDWAVGADTLNKNWDVDATYDWFEKNKPGTPSRTAQGMDRDVRATDGALDTDGRTPDSDQRIKSHDGMDTDTTTLRIEREQNGTDVAPSKVREEASMSTEYSVLSEAKDARAASKQLEKESGSVEREIDISDKLNPVR